MTLNVLEYFIVVIISSTWSPQKLGRKLRNCRIAVGETQTAKEGGGNLLMNVAPMVMRVHR